MATQKKKFAVPHQLVIIVGIAILAMIATYFVPAGKYDTIEINGRKAIDAASFHYIDQTSVSPWDAMLALPQGYVQQAKLITMLVMIAASMHVISSTGFFEVTIGKVAKKFRTNLYLIIPILMGLFAILGAIGINTPIIAFIPVAIMLGYSLGGDAMIGVSLGLMGMTCGQAGGAFCTSSTAVAQGLVGLPQFSGWILRIIATVGFWVVGSFYLIRYTRKVQNNPMNSVLYGVEGVIKDINTGEDTQLTKRHIATLVVFIIGLAVIIYAATHGWSTSDALPCVFMLTAFVCGLVSGMSINEICKQFGNGAKTMALPCVVMGFATGINIILTKGNVLHTLVHALASLFANTTSYISAMGLYVSNLIINFVICSSSGQATTVIPIFSGMGDVLNLTQQTVVQTFNFGDAITNCITPLSSTLMASIGLANIPLDKWYKFIWKWVLLNIIVGAVFVIIGVAMNYGPF